MLGSSRDIIIMRGKSFQQTHPKVKRIKRIVYLKDMLGPKDPGKTKTSRFFIPPYQSTETKALMMQKTCSRVEAIIFT